MFFPLFEDSFFLFLLALEKLAGNRFSSVRGTAIFARVKNFIRSAVRKQGATTPATPHSCVYYVPQIATFPPLRG